MRFGLVSGNVTVNQGYATGPVRTVWAAYLEQVRRVAPPDPPGLIGREAELAELAAFCLEPNRGPYIWWRAGPWAGKSALLSTFVLHPPEPVRERVRIVSFFITARLAAQDTREAFTEVLLEQLADLTGQDLPAALSDAKREAYLLRLLANAAEACRKVGGTLVLVVDGLDEDRGVTLGPDAHSIAGLLPADPPAGMRVIVAGRPNPPIPDDVPDFHPLRDHGIIRLLSDSPHARDLQRLGRQELKRLLKGTVVEQDILGFLTTARGGLSALDLAELTGAPLWEIEEILHTVAGRTFTRRVSTWIPGGGPEVYLLGHEELQDTASGYLDPARLADYRHRLNAWAETYRTKGWPCTTPEYLLRGYFQLLITTNDLPRLVACATDSARHDRMLDLTGGDVTAIAEVRTALDLTAAQDVPDLAVGLHLAYHRDYLTDRNSYVPTNLPAVWAILGQTTRAQAFATSITNPYQQTQAVAQIAGALARVGKYEQAEQFARTINDPAGHALNDPAGHALALAHVAKGIAQSGQHERAADLAGQAEQIARTITDPNEQASALIQIAAALARAGRHEQAEQLADTITDRAGHVLALAHVAEALAHDGQHEQAADLAGQAAAASLTIADPDEQALALAQVAGALARAGQHEEAADLAEQAEQVARTITDPYEQATALAEVTEALVRAGQLEQAEQLARTITEPAGHAQALAEVAEALVHDGQHERAAALAGRAEHVARTIADPAEHVLALAELSEALVRAGQHDEAAALAGQAEQVARTITEPYEQVLALIQIVGGLARAGQHEQAEQLACTITDSAGHARALAQVAEALAQSGQHEQAADLAGQAAEAALTIADPDEQALALAQVASALARAGQHEQAAALAGQAEQVAGAITNTHAQAWALTQVASALAQAGHHEQAELLARTITSTYHQACALAQVASALAQAGHHERAEQLARTITNTYAQAWALAELSEALAQDGQHDQAAAMAGQAEQLARTFTNPYSQAQVLAEVADVFGSLGDRRMAHRVAAAACLVGRWTIAVKSVLLLDPSAFTLLGGLLGCQARRQQSVNAGPTESTSSQ